MAAHKSLIAVAVLSLLRPEPVAAEARARYGGVLIGGLLGEPVLLDPVMARSHAELTVVGAVCDTLYRIDERGVPVPHLALALPTVDPVTGLIRIPLRRDVRFHDGSALGADDVVATLERARRSSAAGWLLAPISAIEADGDTIVLELRRAAPELPALLASPATAVTPGGNAPRRDALIGSGPFRVRAVERNRKRVVLEAFDDHFAGRPYVDVVELRWYDDPDGEARAYERGDTHWSLRGAVAFAGHRPKHPTDDVTGAATVVVYVGFGTAHKKVLSDPHLRRALSLALDRDSFRHLGTGEPIDPIVDPAPPALGGPAPSRKERGPRREAAGLALRRGTAASPALRAFIDRGEPLEILVDRTRPDDREIADKVAAALFGLGLRARVTELDAPELARRARSGACDLYIGQLAAPFADPALMVAAARAAGGDDPGADLRAGGPELAAQLAAFDAALPVIPLFARGVRAHHRSALGGAAFDALGRLSFADVFVID